MVVVAYIHATRLEWVSELSLCRVSISWETQLILSGYSLYICGVNTFARFGGSNVQTFTEPLRFAKAPVSFRISTMP